MAAMNLARWRPGTSCSDRRFVSKTPAIDVDLNLVAVFLRVVELQELHRRRRGAGVAQVVGEPERGPAGGVARGSAASADDAGGALTEAGRPYVREASPALARAGGCARDALPARSAAAGRRCGSPLRPTSARWCWPRSATRFVRRTPGITLEFLLTAPPGEPGGRGGGPGGARRAAAGLVAPGAAGERAGGLDFAAPAYLDAHRDARLGCQELGQHDCVLFRPRRGRRSGRWWGPAARAGGGEGARSRRTTSPSSARRRWPGAGIALLPALLCEQDVARGRLVRVSPPTAAASAPLHVVWPPSRHVPKRVKLVRDWLVSSLGHRRQSGHARTG